MKRIWIATASMVGITALAGAGITYALFTASSGPAEQEFTAGTLVLQGDRDNGDTVPGPMFYIDGATDGKTEDGQDGLYETGLWAPGDEFSRVFQIENVGTLEGKILKFSAELTNGDPLLAGALDVKIYDGIYKDTDGIVVDPDATIIAEGKLSEFFGAGKTLTTPYVMEVGALATFGFTVSFPLDAGNDYQGDSIKVTFSAYAEQLKNN